jgi:hypothetical protein
LGSLGVSHLLLTILKRVFPPTRLAA